MRSRKCKCIVVLSDLTLAGTGCMTNKLWTDGSVVRTHFPEESIQQAIPIVPLVRLVAEVEDEPFHVGDGHAVRGAGL